MLLFMQCMNADNDDDNGAQHPPDDFQDIGDSILTNKPNAPRLPAPIRLRRQGIYTYN